MNRDQIHIVISSFIFLIGILCLLNSFRKISNEDVAIKRKKYYLNVNFIVGIMGLDIVQLLLYNNILKNYIVYLYDAGVYKSILILLIIIFILCIIYNIYRISKEESESYIRIYKINCIYFVLGIGIVIWLIYM